MRAFTVILAFATLCGGAELKTGEPAPPLTLSQVLQAPSGTVVSWQGMKGNVVVLEFWATWCAGCRDEIPHLNRMEEQFRNRPVRFLSVTDEEPGIVRHFLKDYPISGWVGLDSGEQTFKQYGINGRPTTVLVDATGVVRGIGFPSDLTASTIESLLAGKPVAFSREAVPATKLQALPDPLYQVMIRPAGPVEVTGFSPGAVSGKAGKRWEAWGVWLARVLSEAYEVPEERIEAPMWATQAGRVYYDIALAAPDLTAERRRGLLRGGMEEVFQLKIHKEARVTDVYVLQRRPGIEHRLRPAQESGSSRWGKNGQVTAVAAPMTMLVSAAAQSLGKTVVDETGLNGRFDFELKWDPAKPQALSDALRTQLGLDLAAAKRPLQYVVVDSAVQPQLW